MKQEQFLDVAGVEEARARWARALALEPLAGEQVPLEQAWDRVLAEDVRAPGDVPVFDRSNVDGFAVRAQDTFGASERSPAKLRLVAAGAGAAGTAPQCALGPGEAAPIATGAMLPRGADAVVMVEETELEPGGIHVRVSRPVAPGGRLSHAGSDVGRGETLLLAGTRLSARETGTLAACGIATVVCHRRPRVAILSTGDELVAPGGTLALGQVHDANARLLADAVRELGGEPELLGIARDEPEHLRSLLQRAAEGYDAVLLSGGTSKGPGDLSVRLLAEVAEIVVHGVALKPGKPLCLAARAGRPWAVLPGFPASAAFTFHAFVAPVLRRLAGASAPASTQVEARLPRGMASEAGRMEFTLVNLVPGREGLVAFPLGKGSGSVTTFARADGFFAVPAEVERLEAGAPVTVTLLGRSVEPCDLVIVGSHCTGLERVLAWLARRGITSKALWVGSRGGVEAAREGACDAAPLHLLDAASGTWNAGFAPPGTRLLPGYGRRQGLALRRGGEHFQPTAADEERLRTALRSGRRQGLALRHGDEHLLPGATTEERLAFLLRNRSAVIANRNPAAGTRALLEQALERAQAAPPAGWGTAYRSHTAVAAAIAQGRADYGVCIESAARGAGLAWLPWREERYDLLVPEERWERPGVVALRQALGDPRVHALLRAEGLAP